MAYEYLKGMGGLGMGDLGDLRDQTQFGAQGRNTNTPPATDNSRAGTTKESGDRRASGGSANSSGANSSGANNFFAVAIPFEPAPPARCVRTLPAERTELKEYYRKRFSDTSYQNKLRVDASFTYLEADLLAGYRNANAVVADMMRSPRDTTVTVAEVAAFKRWWRNCHVATSVLFDIRQRDAMFVPRVLYTNYKRTFKRDNSCPTSRSAPNKTSCFEYRSVVTAAQLLTQEVERQRVEALNSTTAQQSAAEEQARVAREALTTAQNQLRDLQTQLDTSRADVTAARNEATRWRTAAEEATKKANDLQTAIDGLGKNINTLTNQLASATSPEAAAILQAKITDLMGQLSTAQALQADAIAQAQAAQAAAAQTEAKAVQAEVVVAQTQVAVDTTVAQVSELEPWYIKYKWYLVGAVALAGGAYWYMNKQKAAAVPALTKNRLPEPTSARHPSGLRRNAYSSPDQSDSGRPPRNAPRIIWDLFLNMARSARENGGDSPDASIYWSRRGKQWSIGDNFDRYGHFIAKPTGSGEYSLIYRGEWGDEPISRKHALRQARRFFEESGAADAFRCTMGG